MGLDALVGILIWLVVVFAIAWIAHWVVTTYFPEPLRTPALLVVGVLLLIALLYTIIGLPGMQGIRR